MIALLATSALAQVSFADQSVPAFGPTEIISLPLGGDGKLGCGLLDHDRDGDLDVYLANGPTRANSLFRNDGTRLVDVAAATATTIDTGSNGVLAADLDGDGWTDLLVTGDGGMIRGSTARGPLVVLRNRGDGSFDDVTAASGIVTGAAGLAAKNLMASAADIDGDEDLDVFVIAPGSFITGLQEMNTLWRNEGDGTFTEIGAEAGVARDLGGCVSTFTHLDDDAYVDLIVANCNDLNLASTPFEVYQNDGTGHFRDIAVEAKVWALGGWMGLAVADFTGDGQTDFFATNVGGADFPHALYVGDEGVWREEAEARGVANWEYGWGTVAADFDADTDLDLYYVGTKRTAAIPGGGFAESGPGYLFWNDGTGNFPQVDIPVNLLGLHTTGLCEGDLDADGFSDLVVVPNAEPVALARGFPKLLANEGNTNHWLTVRPSQATANTGAVGARIRAVAGGTTMWREIQAGSSFVSTNSPWPTFGLADATEAAVCVRWPDGVGEDFGVVDGDQQLDLVRGTGLGEVECTRFEDGDGDGSSATPTRSGTTAQGGHRRDAPAGCRVAPVPAAPGLGMLMLFLLRPRSLPRRGR